jgi:hypothetical protein
VYLSDTFWAANANLTRKRSWEKLFNWIYFM